MAIFSDTDEGHVDGNGAHGFARGADDLLRVPCPVEQMIAGNSRGLDNAIANVASETGRVIDANADVFVEVEKLNSVPVDFRRGDNVLEKFKLRSPGGSQQAHRFKLLQGGSQFINGIIGGSPRHRISAWRDRHPSRQV